MSPPLSWVENKSYLRYQADGHTIVQIASQTSHSETCLLGYHNYIMSQKLVDLF